MRCHKLAIAFTLCSSMASIGAYADEDSTPLNASGPMRLCIDAWGKIAACPPSSLFNADGEGDGPESMWLGVEADAAASVPQTIRLDSTSPFARWRGKGHWDMQWSLLSGGDNASLNLAVDRGRPWVNMDLGKLEINMQLDDDDTRLYIGIGERW